MLSLLQNISQAIHKLFFESEITNWHFVLTLIGNFYINIYLTNIYYTNIYLANSQIFSFFTSESRCLIKFYVFFISWDQF